MGGQRMQLWRCAGDGGSGHYFDYSPSYPSMPALIRVAQHPEYCVVIDWNKDSDGAAIQIWTCDAAVQAQQWYVDSSNLIRNAAFYDKCLVVDGNEGHSGQRLQLWSCDGYEQYKTWERFGA